MKRLTTIMLAMGLTACSTTNIELGQQVYGTHFDAKQSNGQSYNNDNNVTAVRVSTKVSKHLETGITAGAGDNSYGDTFTIIGADATLLTGITDNYETGAGIRLGACEGYKHISNGHWFPCGSLRGVVKHKAPKTFKDRFGLELNYIPTAGTVKQSMQTFVTFTVKTFNEKKKSH